MIEALGKFTISRHYDFLLDIIEMGLKDQGFETVSTTDPICDLIDISVIPSNPLEDDNGENCDHHDCKYHKKTETKNDAFNKAFSNSCDVIRRDTGVFQYIGRLLKKELDDVSDTDIARIFGISIKTLFNEYHKLADAYSTASTIANRTNSFINYILSNKELKDIYIDKILVEDEELYSVYQETGKIDFSHIIDNVQRIFEIYFEDSQKEEVSEINEEDS